MTTYTATFPDGTTATRRSDATYVAASRSSAWSGGKVRWHKSIAAARTAAGSQGQVVIVDAAAAADASTRKCVVCDGSGIFSERTASGAIRSSHCWRCGGRGNVPA